MHLFIFYYDSLPTLVAYAVSCIVLPLHYYTLLQYYLVQALMSCFLVCSFEAGIVWPSEYSFAKFEWYNQSLSGMNGNAYESVVIALWIVRKCLVPFIV